MSFGENFGLIPGVYFNFYKIYIVLLFDFVNLGAAATLTSTSPTLPPQKDVMGHPVDLNLNCSYVMALFLRKQVRRCHKIRIEYRIHFEVQVLIA